MVVTFASRVKTTTHTIIYTIIMKVSNLIRVVYTIFYNFLIQLCIFIFDQNGIIDRSFGCRKKLRTKCENILPVARHKKIRNTYYDNKITWGPNDPSAQPVKRGHPLSLIPAISIFSRVTININVVCYHIFLLL